MDTVIGGSTAYIRPTPAFSFHTIIDEDISILSYIILNYYDTSIFDFSEAMHVDFGEVISRIYYRKEENPLKLFMVEGADESFVDECYYEFINEKEEEILANSIYTEIPKLIRSFQDSAGINPVIFYYNDAQKTALDAFDLLKDIPKIPVKDVTNDRYSQIYLKDYTEAKNFPDLINKTFYFATSGRNVEVFTNGDFINIKELDMLAANRNHISLYDLYNSNIVNEERLTNKGDSNERN